MIRAIIADVHANEIALRAVMADAKAHGARGFISLGDTVGYGPEPAAAVALTRSMEMVLAGNHDDAVSGRGSADGFIGLAADAARRHRGQLGAADLDWLAHLPYVCRGNGYACTHGDFTAPEEFAYVDSEDDAAANFAARGEQLLFVGHTHLAEVFVTGGSGRVHRVGAVDFAMEDGKRYIVNPGSVGYPRGKESVSTYVLYDSEARTIEFRRVPFTVRSVMQTEQAARRKRWPAVVGVLAALAAGGGVAAAMMATRDGAPKAVVPETERARAACECEMAVAGMRKVAVRIGVERGPLQVRLTFEDARGRVIGEERYTVKRRKNAKVKVPQGAAKVRLEGEGGTATDFRLEKTKEKEK